MLTGRAKVQQSAILPFLQPIPDSDSKNANILPIPILGTADFRSLSNGTKLVRIAKNFFVGRTQTSALVY